MLCDFIKQTSIKIQLRSLLVNCMREETILEQKEVLQFRKKVSTIALFIRAPARSSVIKIRLFRKVILGYCVSMYKCYVLCAG